VNTETGRIYPPDEHAARLGAMAARERLDEHQGEFERAARAGQIVPVSEKVARQQLAGQRAQGAPPEAQGRPRGAPDQSGAAMRAQVAAGVCEVRDCGRPFTHVVRWDELGAPEPAFLCDGDARSSRRAGRRVQTVAEFTAETGLTPLEAVSPRPVPS
jgi:hypothetical protein